MLECCAESEFGECYADGLALRIISPGGLGEGRGSEKIEDSHQINVTRDSIFISAHMQFVKIPGLHSFKSAAS